MIKTVGGERDYSKLKDVVGRTCLRRSETSFMTLLKRIILERTRFLRKISSNFEFFSVMASMVTLMLQIRRNIGLFARMQYVVARAVLNLKSSNSDMGKKIQNIISSITRVYPTCIRNVALLAASYLCHTVPDVRKQG